VQARLSPRTGRGRSACSPTRESRCARCSPTSWRPGGLSPPSLVTRRSATRSGRPRVRLGCLTRPRPGPV